MTSHRRGARASHLLSRHVVAVLAALAAPAALGQQPGEAPADGSPATTLDEVVVTGYRQALNAALSVKREEVVATDSIFAEDIADFPDLNLSESLQRLPGVSIARDAGEGRQISVRGLGPQFTRVRINGMEALTTTGGTDASGGTNRDRAFDFNIFASELFNKLTVRKTSSADVEEGSLGATVDLSVARPFDFEGLTFVASAQAGYNDLSDEINPRAALLASGTFADGRLGALVSVAYTKRDLLEEGSSTVRWQNSGGAAGSFGPLGPGYAASGSTATLAQINSAFRPRIPRYDTFTHEQERLGVTASLQFRPAESTLFSLDAMYADYDATREEIFLSSPVFSTNGPTGINNVNPNAAFIDGANSLVYGVFDDVDIRSEARFDELSTKFEQITLDATHEFSDTLRIHGLAGYAESAHENPVQTTLLWDADDVDGYSYDFRGNSRLPVITYGTANVQSPSTWRLSQIRLRPQTADNDYTTVLGDLEWDFTDALQLAVGLQWRQYEFATTERRRSNGTTANIENVIPASALATPTANYARLVSFGDGLGVPAGTPTSWVVPDLGTAAGLFNLYDPAVFRLGTEPALGNNRSVEEESTAAYVQLNFETSLAGIPIRGGVGVRYVQTTQDATGYTFTSGLPLLTSVENDYDDTLPSLNLVAQVTDEFLVRVGAAKVMARPGLGNLNPGANVTVSGANRTVVAGNPELDPFRATAYDLSFEWYFAPEALLSLALFYKDIDSFVQTIRETRPFTGNPLGLPDSVAVAACGTTPGCSPAADWNFDLPANTPGGDLQGFEISYQQPFTFLPGAFRNLGVILNYTYVDSEVKYVNSAGAVVAEQTLTGLSKTAYNATLYWQSDRFSARVSAAYRDEYLTTVPGRNGNDVEGTAETLNVDASATWNVNDNFSLSIEALNLTDEFNDQWVDSAGDRLSVYHHTGREYFIGGRYRY